MNSVLFSRKTDNWRTPTHFYNLIMKLGYFDPCPFLSSFNGLDLEWKSKNFVNPPFSKIKDFVNKGIEESKKGKVVVFLIPCRTDTKYFRKLVDYGCIIYFISGRLKFNDSNSAPFPSCLIFLTGNKTKCYWIDSKEVDI